MSTFAGSSLVVSWMQPAATTILTGDHKSLTYTPSINFIDATAGADTHKTYIAGVKDGSATYSANMQGGTASGGTITFSTVAEGNLGTLKIQPEGTASTKPYINIPAISQGAAFNYPYQDVVEVTVNFQQNGARVEGSN